MEVEKLNASGAPNAMKSEAGNKSIEIIETIIRQTIGKGSMVSFSTTGDCPVHCIQLFNPLDKPDSSKDMFGLPWFSPMKNQLQKCEKCPKEFCSPINYRRHIRMHRHRSRSLNVDKESHKNRDLLGAFWDNLSLEDTKNVVSIDDVSLKEVSGSSVVEALTSAHLKPAILMMPQPYVMSGACLLAKDSILPMSSQELFNILDYASEGTFLCAGMAESVQKFIIDGKAEEALEMRNLVASVSLLFEQKLVRAWLADKEAEALRCQKLLEKEEEEAEKRRSQLSKRRQQKQLRQQEQKAREQLNRESVDSADKCIDSVDGPSVTEISQVSFDNNQDTLADMNSSLKPAQLSNEDILEDRLDLSNDHVYGCSVQSVDSPIEMENGQPQVMIDEWQVPKSRSKRSGRTGVYGTQNLQAFKLESFQKQGLLKNMSAVKSEKVQTRKSKVEIDDESSGINLQNVEPNNIDKSNFKLLIGAISVPVSTSEEKHATQGAANICSVYSASSKDDKFPEGSPKSNSVLDKIDQATTKLVSICPTPTERSVSPVQSGNPDSVEIVTSGNVERNGGVGREKCLPSSPTTMDKCGKISHLERNDQLQRMLFSNDTARAFLAQRWKEAISGDHVKLVLSHEAPGNPDDQNDSSSVGVPSPGVLKHMDLGDAETRLAGIEASVAPIDNNTRAKSRRSKAVPVVGKKLASPKESHGKEEQPS